MPGFQSYHYYVQSSKLASFVFKCRFFNRKEIHKRRSSSEIRVLMPPLCTWRCSYLGREAGPGLRDLSGCRLPHHAPLATLPEPLGAPLPSSEIWVLSEEGAQIRAAEKLPLHPATSCPGWCFCSAGNRVQPCGAEGPRGRPRQPC